jgi:hypothetical protein
MHGFRNSDGFILKAFGGVRSHSLLLRSISLVLHQADWKQKQNRGMGRYGPFKFSTGQGGQGERADPVNVDTG